MKINPEVFMEASNHLIGPDDLQLYAYIGLCYSIKKACDVCEVSLVESYYNELLLLIEYFEPENASSYWWVDAEGRMLAKETQEERFIALCLLYEIAKDMQNGQA